MTIGWHFDNTYSKLSDTFKEKVKPTPVHSPELVVLNDRLAKDLTLDFSKVEKKDLSQLFSGNTLPEGSSTFSLKVSDNFEYVLSKCQPMVILIN